MHSRTALGVGIVVLAAGVLGGCRRERDRAEPTESARDRIERVRALPYAAFTSEPDEEADGVVEFDPERSSPGYNFLSLFTLCRAELLDEHGEVVNAWERRPCSRWANGTLLANGDVVIVGADDFHRGRGFPDDIRFLMRMSWDGAVIWKRRIPAHHDVEVAPGGGLSTLTMSLRSIPAVHDSIATRDNEIVFLTMDGERQSALSMYDACSRSPEVFRFGSVAPRRWLDEEIIDLFHGNSVATAPRHLRPRGPLYAEGSVMACLRHQDAVVVFDGERGEAVWSWGPGEISGPHDATYLDNGNILIFDNGLSREWSRVIELDPVGKKIVWEYRAPDPPDFHTVSRGGAQRLPNGNTLITESDSGESFEVTPDGETVWRYRTPHRDAKGRRSTIIKITRYSEEFVERILGRRGEGPPAEDP